MRRPIRSKIEGLEFASRRCVSEYDPEELLQRSVWEWWILAGQRAFPMVGMRAIPNGGLRSKKVAGRLKMAGVVAGVADFHLTIGPIGRTGWIELKKGEIRNAKGTIIQRRGVQSPEQLVFQATEISRGALYAVCDSLEQVIATIAKWTDLPTLPTSVRPVPKVPNPANETDPVKLLTAC